MWLLLPVMHHEPFPLFSLSRASGSGLPRAYDAVAFSGSPLNAIAPVYRIGNGSAAAGAVSRVVCLLVSLLVCVIATQAQSA